MLWKHNGKIVTREGKIINCDKCPCQNYKLHLDISGTDYNHIWKDPIDSLHTFTFKIPCLDLYTFLSGSISGDTETHDLNVNIQGIHNMIVTFGNYGSLKSYNTFLIGFDIEVFKKTNQECSKSDCEITHEFEGCVESSYYISWTLTELEDDFE